MNVTLRPLVLETKLKQFRKEEKTSFTGILAQSIHKVLPRFYHVHIILPQPPQFWAREKIQLA